MVAEPWIHKIRKKNKSKVNAAAEPPPLPSTAAAPTIGILSFEVAATMSRAIHLHRSLSDASICSLRTHILSSPAVHSLVSTDERHLLALVLAEKLDDLNRIAAATSRLGRRCAHPALLGFDHVYADLLAGRIPDPSALGFLSKDIDAAVRRMERLVSSTASLYTELDSLTDLEHSAAKFSAETRQVLDQKLQWQRHEIKMLRDSSLWNQSYDKVVILLARAVCSIHARIRLAFGEAALGLDSLLPEQSRQLSASPCRHIPLHSGPISVLEPEIISHRAGPGGTSLGPISVLEPEIIRHRAGPGGTSPGRLLLNCLSLSSAFMASGQFEDDTNSLSPSGSVELSSITRFGPKSSLTSLAQPSTIGGSALALHYANVIIIIEKLLRYPHLIGDETRDDLYQMLTSSLRTALRRSLKLYVKNLAIYDAPLAHNWKDAMGKILSWLGPMAHNMIQWQTERNFEQQQIVSRANVLLLETLYFADREKTEAAICELLVGLNYICRYEQQHNALMDCTSSVDFEGCMDWQTQY